MSEHAPDQEFMGPPSTPAEVECIHCGKRYSSVLIWWEPVSESKPDRGFWRCPTPDCDGAGFLFDIWPTDPNYRDDEGNKVFYQGEDEA